MRIGMWMTALAVLGCASGGAAPPEGGIRDVAEDGGGANGREGQHIAYTSGDIGIESVVPVGMDSAWSAMTMAYKSLGFELLTISTSQHVLGNRHVIVMNTMLGKRIANFLDCGQDPTIGIPRADRYRVTLSVVSTLSAKDSDDTRVKTLVTAEASDMGTSASPVYCRTTGRLEKALLHAAGFAAS